MLRIAEVNRTAALSMVGVQVGTYNSWTSDGESSFVQIYRRLPELSEVYRLEAIKELRRDNQINAVMLEAKIIQRMTEEIESGEYSLIRTLLGRDVYSKLMNDLDYQPSTQMNWLQFLSQNFARGGGERPNEGQIIEATAGQLEEHQEGTVLPQGQ